MQRLRQAHQPNLTGSLLRDQKVWLLCLFCKQYLLLYVNGDRWLLNQYLPLKPLPGMYTGVVR